MVQDSTCKIKCLLKSFHLPIFHISFAYFKLLIHKYPEQTIGPFSFVPVLVIQLICKLGKLNQWVVFSYSYMQVRVHGEKKKKVFSCFPIEAKPTGPHSLYHHLSSLKKRVVSFGPDWAKEQ